MQTKTLIGLGLMAAIAMMPSASAAETDSGGNCNSTTYGVAVNTWAFADCGDYYYSYNHCDQSTGAAGGAGSGALSAGSPGGKPESAASSNVGADTRCTQSGGNSTGGGEDFEFPWTGGQPDQLELFGLEAITAPDTSALL